MNSGASEDHLFGVWGSSPSDVFAVGSSGTILHYVGQAALAITSVNPSQGNQGETLDVVITGSNFAGTTAVSFGSGINVNSFTVDSTTQITADITIEATAMTGARDVSVTAPGGTDTLDGGFTVTETPNQAPNQPGNVSPLNGAINISLGPVLESSAFDDPDIGDTHSASQWQVTTTSGDYSSLVFDSGTNTTNLVQITIPSGTLNYGTAYYWRVRHQDNHGAWSSYSLETSFTTMATVDTTPPTTPVVTDDGDSATSTAQLHTTWSSSDPESGIAEYQYAIGTSAGETDVVHWTSAETDTEVTHTGLNLTSGTTYYFAVKAKNGAGEWSEVGVSDGITIEEEQEAVVLPFWIWIIIGLVVVLIIGIMIGRGIARGRV